MGKKHKKTPPTCDPAKCDNCIYIGEGDFICDSDNFDDDPVIVVEDWTPTDEFERCRRHNK